MGGKAAKERRRLARLAAAAAVANRSIVDDGIVSQRAAASTSSSPSLAGNDESVGTSNRQKNEKEKGINQFVASNRPAADRGGSRRSLRPNNSKLFGGKRSRQDVKHRNETHTKKAEPTRKKPKVKKPKHLKRKIEKLSKEEGDDEECQKLINELNEFHALKATMAKPTTKRQKGSKSFDTTEVRKEVPDRSDANKEEFERTPRLVDTATSANDNEQVSVIVNEPDIVVPKVSTSSASKGQQVAEDDSDSDSDVSLQDTGKRQRGRRRRGRKLTEEHSKTELEATEVVKDKPVKTISPEDCSEPLIAENASGAWKKTPKKDDKRRCIGRKPVTDFVIGQRYSGKVVYTKQFGAFIDIGCHSDAFCHVSRVKDDYVEFIDDALRIEQEVNARIVEVDRKAKRITVSLQSDARIEDERASIEARRERKEKNVKRKHNTKETSSALETKSSAQHSSPSEHTHTASSPPAPVDESTMTPAELKRARKLARRAARREQQAKTGLSA